MAPPRLGPPTALRLTLLEEGQVAGHLLSPVLFAQSSLTLDLAFPLPPLQELVDLLEDGHVAGHVLERRRDEIQMLRAVNTRLEASLMDLDFQICKFCDV